MTEIFTSPLNLCLLGISAALLFKIFKSSRQQPVVKKEETVPKLAKQDITLKQLRQYDGSDPNKSICVAVNGKVFDVTKGKKFYGPEGPYHAFAGHDATRALATFNVGDVKSEHDDLSDLSTMEMDSVREWEMQFYEKYEYVGRLLKPGEQPGDYSEEDENKEAGNKKQSASTTTQPVKTEDEKKDE